MFKLAISVLWSMLVNRYRMPGRSWATEFSCRIGRKLFFIGSEIPVESFRRMMAKVSIPDPIMKSVSSSWHDVAGTSCLVIRPNHLDAHKQPKHVIAYLHGGGYTVGHPDAYQSLVSHIAVGTDACVYLPDYRLSPENPFPAGQDDCLAVVRALQESHPEAVLPVMGDSAGGGLSIATVQSLAADPSNAKVDNLVLLSPWVEPTATTGSITSNVPNDIFIPEFLIASYESHIQNADKQDTRVNLINADLSNLPRTLLQVAGGEMFFDQGVEFAERAKREGSDVELDVYPTQFHVFPVLGPKLKDTAIAISKINGFINNS
jgi:acetyl esterase/lipase